MFYLPLRLDKCIVGNRADECVTRWSAFSLPTNEWFYLPQRWYPHRGVTLPFDLRLWALRIESSSPRVLVKARAVLDSSVADGCALMPTTHKDLAICVSGRARIYPYCWPWLTATNMRIQG